MTQGAGTPSPTGIVINSQVQTSGRDAAGNFGEGYDVYFTTGNGHTGKVFVADRAYNVDNVRAAVAAKAATIDAVGSLTF